MYIRFFLLIAFLLSISHITKAQNGSPYEIINALSGQINGKFPMLDSLYPLRNVTFEDKGWSVLTNGDRKKLKKTIRQSVGFKLIADSLKDRNLIPAFPIFQIFSNFDSAGAKLIEQVQPFYMLSNPVFISPKKVVIKLSLIKGFGYTYILEKKGANWAVIKEIYCWM